MCTGEERSLAEEHSLRVLIKLLRRGEVLFYVLWSHQYEKHTATDPKSFCFTRRETFFGLCSLTGKTTDPAFRFCLFSVCVCVCVCVCLLSLVIFVLFFDTQLKRESKI